MNFFNSTHSVGALGVIQTITNIIPNAPTSLTYIASSATTTSVSVSFTLPNNVAITSVYTPSSGTGSGTNANYTVSGLSSNTSYSLTVRANSIFGKVGTASSALTVLTLPAAPTIGVATVTDTTHVSVAFTAPTGTGTITGYTVTSNVGSFTGTGTSSPVTVTASFVSGTAYTFTVTATNASGTSVASAASTSVTPNSGANNIIFSNNGSSLTGWTNNGFSVSTVGGQTCLYAPNGGNYIYIYSGVNSLAGYSINFNVYLTGGCPNFFFSCNSSGNGQMLRFEQRNNGGSGFASTSSWTGWNGPGSAYTWTQNAWLAVTISITSGGVATFSVNGVASGITYTIADNGGYIGIQSDNGGGSISVNNITIVNNGTYNGLSSATAAPSAAYLVANGNTTNGVYWITVPTAGAKQIYCILDRAVDGGGWMMAMKATKGTTFQYSANYWTTVNTLNPTDTNRNDGDAKFDTMNYSPASDLLALWPDLTSPVGGSLTLTGASYSCWSWLQNRFTSAGTFYVGTNNNPSTTTVSGITPSMTLINWFNTISTVRYFIQDAITWSGWGNRNMFSSQKDVRFYGFNYLNNGDKKTRWGFGWNENGDYNGQNQGTALSLFPKGDMGSDDVFGGIGMASNNYSAGDYKSCCEDYLGFNRQARVEIYIRDSSSSPSAPTSVSASGSGSTVTVTFTGVATASYYTAFSNSGGFYASSSGSPITITGMTTGVTYTFTVKASNTLGTSTASAASGNVSL